MKGDFKKLKMMVTITVPIWTEVQNAREEFPTIRDTIIDQIDDHIISLGHCMSYNAGIESGKAVGLGEDACTVEYVECMTDWSKTKIKVEKVKYEK